MATKDYKYFFSLFSLEEMIFLNQMGMDVSKDECIFQIKLSLDICVDEAMLMALQDFLDKVNSISTEDWSLLQKYLPFPISIEGAEEMDLEELD